MKPPRRGGGAVGGRLLQGPRAPATHGKTGARPGGKMPSIKNQMRGIERLLRKPDLDPRVRASKEQQLAELQAKQEALSRTEREKRLATKYHKVRFFERVKLERQLARVQRQLGKLSGGAAQAAHADSSDAGVDSGSSSGSDPEGGDCKGDAAAAAQLRKRLSALQADLLYVRHFPPGERYVSLFKQGETPAAQAALDTARARLRALVLAKLAEGAALADADEGAAIAATAAANVAGKGPRPQQQQQQQQFNSHQRDSDDEESESESDDFFMAGEADVAGEADGGKPMNSGGGTAGGSSGSTDQPSSSSSGAADEIEADADLDISSWLQQQLQQQKAAPLLKTSQKGSEKAAVPQHQSGQKQRPHQQQQQQQQEQQQQQRRPQQQWGHKPSEQHAANGQRAASGGAANAVGSAHRSGADAGSLRPGRPPLKRPAQGTDDKQPLRTRAEGGRRRRAKK